MKKFTFKHKYRTGGSFSSALSLGIDNNRNIIVGGVGHHEKNMIGDRGVPVVPSDVYYLSGGKYDKNTKVAEIESAEIIFSREIAKKINELVDEFDDCGCPGKLVALGSIVKGALQDTSDETCRVKCEYKPKLDKIK